MDRKVLLITGFTDDFRDNTSTDNSMSEVFDLTLKSKQKYTQKHGYDLLALRSFPVDKKKVFKPHQYAFLRVALAMDMMEIYDTVMWVDADAMITNDNYKIEDFQLDDQHCFYASYAWCSRESFSAGNFILNKTEQLNDLCNSFYANAHKFPDEQETLNALYKYTYLKSFMKILENKYFDSLPTVEMYTRDVWVRSDIPYPWTEDAFMVHVGGIWNRDRIRILKNHFSKFI